MRPTRLAAAVTSVLTAAALAVPLASTAPPASATPANPENPRSSRLAAIPGGSCLDNPADELQTYRHYEASRGWCAALTQDQRVLFAGEEYPPFPSSNYDLFGDFVRISAAPGHLLALDDRGDVAASGFWDERAACWYDDQCEDPTNPVSVPPVVQAATITQVAAGTYHDLALTDDGEVLTWGPGTSDPAYQVPAALDGQRVVRIDAGPNTAAAITEAGRLVVWGDLSGHPLPPRLRDPATRVSAVDVSDSWGLALTADDTLLAFGEEKDGRLDVPSAVRRGDVTAFAAGDRGGLAATVQTGVHAWGVTAAPHPPGLAGRVVDLSAGATYSSGALYRRLVATRLPVLPRVIFGRTVTAIPPRWSVTPTKVLYRWERYGRPIPGARGLRYTPSRAETGHGLTFVVYAAAPGYPYTRVEDDAYRRIELRVVVPRTVSRGRYLTVTVRGLADRQLVRAEVWGGRAYGRSDGAGVASVRVPVTRDTPLGRQQVVAFAAASAPRPEKWGSAHVTVTR